MDSTWAIINQGGKQYRVYPNLIFETEKVSQEAGSSFDIPSSFLSLNGKLHTCVSGKVVVSVLGHKKDDKVYIFKKKRRHTYRRFKGHRQNLSVLKVLEVTN